MPWVKFDDAALEDEKVANWSVQAFTVWAKCIFYSARNLTDGRVPQRKALEFLAGGSRRVFEELVPHTLHTPGTQCKSKWCATGLIGLAEGYYLVHNYLRFQPPAAPILAKRAQTTAARKEAGRLGGIRSGASRNRNRFADDGRGKANGIDTFRADLLRREQEGESFDWVPHARGEVDDIEARELNRNEFRGEKG